MKQHYFENSCTDVIIETKQLKVVVFIMTVHCFSVLEVVRIVKFFFLKKENVFQIVYSKLYLLFMDPHKFHAYGFGVCIVLIIN